MVRAAELGLVSISLDEFDALPTTDAQQLIARAEKREAEREERDMKLRNETAQQVIKAIGQVVRAVHTLARALAG